VEIVSGESWFFAEGASSSSAGVAFEEFAALLSAKLVFVESFESGASDAGVGGEPLGFGVFEFAGPEVAGVSDDGSAGVAERVVAVIVFFDEESGESGASFEDGSDFLKREVACEEYAGPAGFCVDYFLCGLVEGPMEEGFEGVEGVADLVGGVAEGRGA